MYLSNNLLRPVERGSEVRCPGARFRGRGPGEIKFRKKIEVVSYLTGETG